MTLYNVQLVFGSSVECNQTEAIEIGTQILPCYKIMCSFKRGFRISNLFNYKDRFPIACKSMVVYYICCRKCGQSQAYIGKTINSVYERFYASGMGHLNPTNIVSSLLNHINESGDPDCSF